MNLYEIEAQRRLLLSKLAAIDLYHVETGKLNEAERARIVAALDLNSEQMPDDVVLRSQSLDERHAPLKPNTIRRIIDHVAPAPTT